MRAGAFRTAEDREESAILKRGRDPVCERLRGGFGHTGKLSPRVEDYQCYTALPRALISHPPEDPGGGQAPWSLYAVEGSTSRVALHLKSL